MPCRTGPYHSTHGLHRSPQVRFCEFAKPDGWIAIPLRPMGDATEDGVETEGYVAVFRHVLPVSFPYPTILHHDIFQIAPQLDQPSAKYRHR